MRHVPGWVSRFHSFRLPAALAIGSFLLALCVLPPAIAQRRDSGSDIFSHEELCRKDFQTGQEYLKNRRLADAAEAFSAVVEACPDMIDAYLNLGLIQVQMKQYMEAIDTYQDALDEDDGNLDVQEALAYALSSAGELDDAIDLYLELREARPEKTDLLRNLVFVYKQKGLVAEAIMLYNKLLELGTDDPLMVSEAGSLALEKKLFLPAVTFYKKLYQHNPEDINTLSILGGYYFKTKFYKEAIEYYNKILEVAPENPNALMHHQVRGLCFKNIGEYEKAAEDFEYVVSKRPDDVFNFCNLAFIYKDAGLYDRAIETVRRGLERHPSGGCLYYAWGLALEGRGSSLGKGKRFKEAIDSFEEAKVKFQKVIDLGDAHFGSTAKQQLARMDGQIERVISMQEKEEMGR